MGRYYTGDIEGKFWFAVQGSDDGEFFGATERNDYINYIVSREAYEEGVVTKGLDKCLAALGVWKGRLDQFFEDNNGYNDEIMAKYWHDEYQEHIDKQSMRENLEWYARYYLGEKIKTFFEGHPNDDCYFEAEV